jgi:long-chain acyl-CoA synthetase
VNNLYQILIHSDSEQQKKTALIFGNNQLSYEVLKDAVERLAQGLVSMGISAGDRIAIMLPNTPHFIISYFALLKIGAIIIPVSVLYKADEIHHQLEDAEVKGIIYWEGLRSNVRKAVEELERCKIMLVLGKKAEPGEVRLTYLIEKNEPLEDVVEVSSDDTALIIYTAGTTGRPKGAELTHNNILSNIESCIKFFKPIQEDSVVGVVPFHLPLGQTLVIGSFLRVGGSILLVPKFEVKELLKIMELNKPSYFVGAPSMYQKMLSLEDSGEIDVSSIKYWLSCGDALKKETMEQFEKQYKVSVLEGYCLTEASPIVSFNHPNKDRPAGSIGLPLPGIELKIVDETDTEVNTGEIGEIIVKGPNVMKGYLNRPEATKEALRGGWLRTGDLARVDESGYSFIEVRKKNVIVKSGFSVYPREVEKFLSGHPKIKEVIVVGLPDKTVGEEVYACIVLKDKEKAVTQEIVEYAKERIAPYKCPKSVFFVLSLPKGPSGRVLRDEVKKLLMKKIKHT